MILNDIVDGIGRRVEGAGQTISGVFEPTVRLGVTGLSRAGKTIFITSLVANLMNRSRMSQLRAASSGGIQAAYLHPQPDDTVPRFDFENHLEALTDPDPIWPSSTRSISQLRLSLRVQPTGLLGGLSGPRTVHLDIVDYPGEWLLDLGLLDKSYAEWSRASLARADTRTQAADYMAALGGTDPAAKLEETTARTLATLYTAYLREISAAGLSDCTPGRFLLPGDLEGSPVLTFAPMALEDRAPRASLYREFERRYEAYKAKVVKPFFRDHFARIDRQIVLVDALGAIHSGPQAVEDMRAAMADILAAFRPGQNTWLGQIFMGRRVEKILFAATKADHLHHAQHARLTAIMRALLREARDRAEFAGAATSAMSLASVRATVEQSVDHDGTALDMVRGRLLSSGQDAAFYAGALPEDPSQILGPARDGAERWLDADYAAMDFAPARLSQGGAEGLPHIRLDRAAEFLIGDRLR
ncbi:MAG: YcjX family protein [Litoreibacter sp.]|nr:YcjX family protein [Litoreibacter sp.]